MDVETVLPEEHDHDGEQAGRRPRCGDPRAGPRPLRRRRHPRRRRLRLRQRRSLPGRRARRAARDGACGPAWAAATRCGSPTCDPGETVLDLGSGGGIDVLLSARRVGPTGKAYGLDMTDEMLELARRNAAEAGVTNVEFRRGHIEDIPLPDALGRRGHLQLRDQPVRRQARRCSPRCTGCCGPAAGSGSPTSSPRTTSAPSSAPRPATGPAASPAPSPAPSTPTGSTAAGFTDVSVEFTGGYTDGMHAAIIRARRP